MRFFEKTKDGGNKSPVDAYVLIEIKSLFSIMVLKFNNGYRDSYHSHAFNAFSWFLFGNLTETVHGNKPKRYCRKILPKLTKRDNLHIVKSIGTSWVFTIRGPWSKVWYEKHTVSGDITHLTHGRKIV